MKKIVSQFINGEHAQTTHHKKALYNPATGEQIKQIIYAEEAVVADAVAAAKAAFSGWSMLAFETRKHIFERFSEKLKQAQVALAKQIMEEEGKSYSAALTEILQLQEYLKHNVTFQALSSQVDITDHQATSVKNLMPLGVVGFLGTPEFPTLTVFYLIPLALMAGNTCVVKPAETAPSVILMLADMLNDCDLPKGVFNVVQGDQFVAEHLIRANGIQVITSVASPSVFLEHLQLAELCGKKAQQIMRPWSLSVVLEDADLDHAVEEIVQSMFVIPSAFSASVSILSASTVMVVDEIADKLISRLKMRMSQFKLGPAQEGEIAIGPLSSEQHLYQIRTGIDKAIEAGAELVLDGRSTYVPGYENGYFMGPCLLDRITFDMMICREDFTGPIVGVYRVPNLAAAGEVFEMLNEVRQLESAQSLRTLQTTCALYTMDQAVYCDFASVVPAVLVTMNQKSTSHLLTQIGGNSLVLDEHSLETMRFCLHFFTRNKTINFN